MRGPLGDLKIRALKNDIVSFQRSAHEGSYYLPKFAVNIGCISNFLNFEFNLA